VALIITKLMGGLSNQMFQYAAGRNLAHRLHGELKLDLSWFEKDDLRNYALGAFNIEEGFATAPEIKKLTVGQPRPFERLTNRLRRKSRKPPPTYVTEMHFHFDPHILNLSSSVYLEGYWQCERYFFEIATLLRHEFTVKVPQKGQNKRMAEHIDSCNSVSIHVRRGDYVSDPDINRVHGTCSLQYYQRCVESMLERVPSPHFFVFSDDPDWVRGNLRLPAPLIIVDHNKNEDYEDLRLMSQCKHHIIANSSFSWWGAWLSSNKNKIVLSPKQWFALQKYNTKDLIPNKWIEI